MKLFENVNEEKFLAKFFLNGPNLGPSQVLHWWCNSPECQNITIDHPMMRLLMNSTHSEPRKLQL